MAARYGLVDKYQLLVRARIKTKDVAWLGAVADLPPLDLDALHAASASTQSQPMPAHDKRHELLESAFLEEGNQAVLRLTHEPTGLPGFEEYKKKIDDVMASDDFKRALKDMQNITSDTDVLKAAIEHTKPKVEVKTQEFLEQLRAQLDASPLPPQHRHQHKQQQGASQFVQSTARDFGKLSK